MAASVGSVDVGDLAGIDVGLSELLASVVAGSAFWLAGWLSKDRCESVEVEILRSLRVADTCSD